MVDCRLIPPGGKKEKELTMNYVIGDIHGKYEKMTRSLSAAGFDGEKDYLFSVGDFSDRGPDSRKVIEYLMSLKDHFRAVFGNHDIWLYQFLKAGFFYTTEEEWEKEKENDSLSCHYADDDIFVVWEKAKMDKSVFRCWLNNGGEETIKSFKSLTSDERGKILSWYEGMPYRIERDRFLIQHTFCSPRKNFFPEGDYSVGMGALIESGRIRKDYDESFWDREMIYYSKEIRGEMAYEMKEEISSNITEKTLIIGHTPVIGYNLPVEPVYDRDLNFILIDTGSFVDDGRRYGLKEAGAVTVLNLDTLEWFTSDGKKGTILLPGK